MSFDSCFLNDLGLVPYHDSMKTTVIPDQWPTLPIVYLICDVVNSTSQIYGWLAKDDPWLGINLQSRCNICETRLAHLMYQPTRECSWDQIPINVKIIRVHAFLYSGIQAKCELLRKHATRLDYSTTLKLKGSKCVNGCVTVLGKHE